MPAEQRAHIGLDVAGLGSPYGGAEPAGQGARAAYVGVDDLAVEEPDEARSGLYRADEQGGVDGVQVEAGGGVAVQRAEQEPPGVCRVGGRGHVSVGGCVGRDGLGLDLCGVALGVGGDGADRDAGGECRGVPPGAVHDQSADEGQAGAEDGGGERGGEVAAVEPVGQRAVGQPAEGEGRDREHPQHHGHRQRLPAVVGGLGATAPEGQQPQPGRVGGGEDGGEQTGDEDDPARGGRGVLGVAGGDVLGGAEDGLLGEEAAEGRDRGECEERHGHRPEGVRDAVAQSAHAGHGGQRVGRRPRG